MSEWTDEEIALAKKLNNEGWSAGKIAEERLMRGKSRNAIIGKLNRLGFKVGNGHRKPGGQISRGTIQKVKSRPTHAVAKNINHFKPKEVETSEFVPVDPGPMVERKDGVELINLEMHHCRYPFGDKDIYFCGQPKLEGCSYCERHAAITISRSSNTPFFRTRQW